MKNKKIKFIFFVLALILFTMAVYYNQTMLWRSRAEDNTLNIKFRLQGRRTNNEIVKGKVVIFNSQQEVINLSDQTFTRDQDNIFTAVVNLGADFDFTKFYSIYIKPEKYVAKIFYASTPTSTSTTPTSNPNPTPTSITATPTSSVAGICHAHIPDIGGGGTSEIPNNQSSSCQCTQGVCAKSSCGNCPSGICDCGNIPLQMPPVTLNCSPNGQMNIVTCQN